MISVEFLESKMKVLTKVSLISVFSFAFGGIDKGVISSAISHIMKEYFTKVSTDLRIVKFSKNSPQLDDIANVIIRNNQNAFLAYEVIDLDESQLVEFELNQSAVLLFHDSVSLMKFFNSACFRVTNIRNLSILAYYQVKANIAWPAIRTSVNFAFLEIANDKVALKVFSYFNPGACKERKEITINHFSTSERKWATKEFFPRKFDDFNDCELTVGIANFRPYHFAQFDQQNNVIKAIGIDIDLLEILAVKLNFSFALVHREADIAMDLTLITIFPNHPGFMKTKLYLSRTYRFQQVLLAVPPGELYSSAEKLFLPFDTATWSCFAAVFSVALIVTLFLNISRDSLRNVFFGSNVNSPTMNLFQHFFGLGQTVLPSGSFARFILIVFILFCLIMRTAYQAKSFEILTSDVRKKGVQTIAELIASNLTVYGQEDFERTLSGMDFLKR